MTDEQNTQIAALFAELNKLKLTFEASAESLSQKVEKASNIMTVAEEKLSSAQHLHTELENTLEKSKNKATDITQLFEGAKTMSVELSGLLASATTQSDQSKNTATQAISALEACKPFTDAAIANSARIEALAVQVEQTAQVAQTRSEHLEAGRKHADEVRGNIDQISTRSTQLMSNIEGETQKLAQHCESVNRILENVQAAKASSDSTLAAIVTTKDSIIGHAGTTKKLAEIAEATEKRVSEYETQLTKILNTSNEQSIQIDKLLLGATNTGLAHAFDVRSKTFKTPVRIWQGLFVLSLVGLVFIAATVTFKPPEGSASPSWEELARTLLSRLPFGLPLIWLAIHSSRQAAFAKRMEEEYAFKATTSMSFEGYRRQMAEVGNELSVDSPLAHLCKNTLATIAAPPGKVYERQRMDPTPGTAANELIRPIVAAVSEKIDTKIPNVKDMIKKHPAASV